MGSKRRRLAKLAAASALVVATGVVGFALLGSASFGAQPPSVPGGPKLPKPDERAVFEVVVEGEATDNTHSQLSQPNANECAVTEDAEVDEKTTYLRGKGVDVEFDRYGKAVLIHRVGRKSDASLAVVISVHRTASGGTQFTPLSSSPCPPATDVSQNPDCGTDVPMKGAMLLAYEDHKLGLSVSNLTLLKGSDDDCGRDPATGINADMAGWFWPTPPKLAAAPGAKTPTTLSLHELFGRRRVIVRELRSNEIGKRSEDTRHVTAGPLAGTVTESAFNKATVRLIRKHRH